MDALDRTGEIWLKRRGGMRNGLAWIGAEWPKRGGAFGWGAVLPGLAEQDGIGSDGN